MEHEKRHLPRALDLESHMAKVRKRNDAEMSWVRASERLSNAFRTMTPVQTFESQHDRNVREFVDGDIDHGEYERREQERLAREYAKAMGG